MTYVLLPPSIIGLLHDVFNVQKLFSQNHFEIFDIQAQ